MQNVLLDQDSTLVRSLLIRIFDLIFKFCNIQVRVKLSSPTRSGMRSIKPCVAVLHDRSEFTQLHWRTPHASKSNGKSERSEQTRESGVR